MGFSIAEKLDFIRQAFGYVKTSSGNINVAISCPFCGSEPGKFKLAIRLADDALHCWVCGYRARSLIPLLRYTKQHSLIEKYVTTFRDNEEYSDDIECIKQLPTLTDVGYLFLACVDHNLAATQRALSYLDSRGLDSNDIWKRALGVSMIPMYSRRIIMPSFSAAGRLNYFTCRSIDNNPRRYLNPDVKRNNIIFNEINIDWTHELVITEGPFDMMKCGDNVTCLLGSELVTDSLLFDMLTRHGTPVVLALDDDAQQKQQRMSSLLASYGINVRIVDLCGAHDMGELSHGDAARLISNARRWNRFDPILTKIRLLRSSTCV